MTKSIYDLKLHEVVSTNNGSHSVTRVPGGWIYHSWRHIRGTDDYEEFASTFVPFHLREITLEPDEKEQLQKIRVVALAFINAYPVEHIMEDGYQAEWNALCDATLPTKDHGNE